MRPPDVHYVRTAAAKSYKLSPKSLRNFSIRRAGPVARRFQTAHEETQHGRFVDEAQAADHLAVLIEPYHPVDDILDLRQRENATRYGQTQQLDIGQDFVAVFVAHARHRSALHAADTRNQVQCSREGTRRIFGLWNMRTEAHRIDMRTEHTRRGDHRNAVFIERFYQIFDKIGALADHRFVERLTQADGHRLDLADRDTAVSKETFVTAESVPPSWSKDPCGSCRCRRRATN